MISKGAKRIAKRLLGRAEPRASDRVAGFFDKADVRALASMPVLPLRDDAVLRNAPKDMQERFVGSSFDTAFAEAADFLNHVCSRLFPDGLPERFDGLRILDFGCSRGRMIRLMRHKRELDSLRVYGCDALREPLNVCRRALPTVILSPVGLYPPSDYRDGLFDAIYAYSVFSHPSEGCHLAWAAELSRILKPGGGVCVTTQPRSFISACRQYREGRRIVETSWHRSLAASFTDPDAESKYDSGELLFSPTGGGDDLAAEAYGEAIVPRTYFERRWGEVGLELVDWWETPVEWGQNRAFFRKTEAPTAQSQSLPG